LKIYIDLSQAIVAAVTDFRQEVESGAFPTVQHSYAIEDEELGKLLAQLRGKVTQDTREEGANHG
jgi:hypothetical protein